MVSDFNCAIKCTLSIAITSVLYSIFYYGILIFDSNFFASIIGVFCINLIVLSLNIRKFVAIGKYKFKPDKRSMLFVFLLLFSLILFLVYTQQWGQWDAWAIWNLHAKFLFYSDFWKNLFTNRIAWTHPDYPLMLPSLIALFWKSSGHISFAVPIIVSALTFVGILTLLFFSLDNPLIKIISVLVLIFDFNFIFQSASQYADTMLAFFYLASTILLSNIKVGENSKKNIFYLLGFVSASCLWVKNEGVIFFIFTSIVLVYKFRKENRAILQYGLGALLLLFVYGMFKLFLSPSNDILSGQSVNIFDKILDLNRYITVILYLGKYIIFKFPILLIIIFYIIFSKQKILFTSSFLIIIFTLLVYLSVYIITPRDLQWHIETSLDRLITQLYPAFIFAFFNQLENIPIPSILNKLIN